MTIFERAAAALETLGVPYANQVYLAASDSTLPDLYLVFFLVSSSARAHADDAETLRINLVQVSIYSRSTLVSLPDVAAAMSAQGFVPGQKIQLPYSPDSGHYGIAQEFIYLEDNNA